MVEQTQTPTTTLLDQLGWHYRSSGVNQANIETCPICYNTNWKFFIRVGGEGDGLWDCKVCSEKGNLFQLKRKLGIRTKNLMSVHDMIPQEASPLPDIEAYHRRLINDPTMGEVLDYLIAERKLTMAVVERFKLGVEEYGGKLWLCIPYLDSAGHCVFAKFRTVPPYEKDFRSVAGRPAPLFNSHIIRPGMDELLMVEGEIDCLSLISNGYESVVAVPGAAMKKADWIERLDRCAPKQIYVCFDNDKAGQTGAKGLAERIGIDKVRNIPLPDFGGKDVNEWFTAGHSLEQFLALKDEAERFPVSGVVSIHEVAGQLIDEMEGRVAIAQFDTPWPSVNERLGPLEEGDVVGVLAQPKVGKAQPLWSKIRTPNGWVNMGSLRVGDAVSSVDGSPSFIIGVFPQGEQPIFKVTFNDGRFTFASKDHLWSVVLRRYRHKGVQTLTTLEIQEILDKDRDGAVAVPTIIGDDSPRTDLFIPPWLMGVLLGDGDLCNSSISVSKTDQFVRDKATELLYPLGYCTSDILGRGKYSGFRIRKLVRSSMTPNPLMEDIIGLGLKDCDSFTKFIPRCYLDSSWDDRLDLLRGLLDTDGTCSPSGHISYSTSSEQLAKDVQYLVRSLGGVSSIVPKVKTYKYLGEKKYSAVNYIVNVGVGDLQVFSLPRKVERQNHTDKKKKPHLKIVSVEYAGVEPCQCISVSHPSKLYVTDNYIVTHNTTFCLNWVDYYTTKGVPSMLFCQEMLPKRMFRKWVSYITQADDTPGRSQVNSDVVKQAIAIGGSRPGDLLFAHTKWYKHEEIYETIRQAQRRYGVKAVCFDNLHLLCKASQDWSQEINRISKAFKQLTLELKILLILIMQPTKIQQGTIVSSNNVYGSGQINADVDAMLCLHRKSTTYGLRDGDLQGAIEIETTLEPELYVNVDLCRYGTGGMCTLYMDGARSTVRERTPSDMVNVPVPKSPSDLIPVEV